MFFCRFLTLPLKPLTALNRPNCQIYIRYTILSVGIFSSPTILFSYSVIQMIFFLIFASWKQPAGLSLMPYGKRGKSGQHRASYFLTESYLWRWSNAEENNRLIYIKVRVRRWSKSPPVAWWHVELCILGVVRSCKPAQKRVARPTSEGRPLELIGDNECR